MAQVSIGDRHDPPPAPPHGRISAAGLSRRLAGGDAASESRGASGGGASGGRSSPGYRRLADRIRGAAENGLLADGIGLPSERELARTEGVSRTTVAAAYALLRDDGWLQSRQGSGSRLRVPAAAAPWQSGIFGMPAPGSPAGSGADTELVAPHDLPLIDLSISSLPAPEEPLRAALAAAGVALQSYLADDGYHPLGLLPLRVAIAEWYSRSQVPTVPEQILVTNGAQHAFSTAVAGLSAVGDRIAIESPSYPVALDAVRTLGRVPVPVPLMWRDDRAGAAAPLDSDWDVDLLDTVLGQSGAPLTYLIPDFQNPTGALMGQAMRERVAAVAHRRGSRLLIDETFRMVPFPSAPPLPPPMAASGSGDEVISLGSLSKSFWGGLRIGWVRAAPAVIDRLAVIRARTDMSGPVLEQLIAVELLVDPEPALTQQRRRLAAGAAAVRTAIGELLPGWRCTDPGGGACLWVQLPGPYATELAALAPRYGVRVVPGSRFGPDGTMSSSLRIPFAADAAVLTEAVRRLAAADAELAPAGGQQLRGWLT